MSNQFIKMQCENMITMIETCQKSCDMAATQDDGKISKDEEKFLKKMKETVDVDACLEQGDFSPINDWNRSHIWQYGRSKDARTLIEEACGKPFDATYYTDYLTKKYDSLYNLRML